MRKQISIIVMFMILICSFGFSDDKNLTDFEVIKLLEKQIGQKLKRCKQENFFYSGKESKNEYDLNENSEVVALKLLTGSVNNLELIKEFSKLKYLYLHNQGVSDIKSIGELQEMETLHLSCIHKLKDISPLKELHNISEFSISCSKVRDISPIKNFKKLKKLRIDDIPISEISAIANLCDLEDLSIDNLEINNISPLKNLKNLTQLEIHEINSFINLAPIKKLLNLERLDLHMVDKVKLPNLKFLKKLKYIRLDVPIEINKIQNLKDLKNLNELYIHSSTIDNVNFLEDLIDLEKLGISYINSADLMPFSNLSNLKFLQFWGEGNFDFSPLKNLNRLEFLEIKSDCGGDITFLKNMEKLKDLTLDLPDISDLSPLKKLLALEKIKFSTDMFSSDSIEEYNTKISRLPLWIADWNPEISLFYLLANSPLEYPPLDVVREGRDAIRKYFKKHEELGKLSDIEIIKKLQGLVNGKFQKDSILELKRNNQITPYDKNFLSFAVDEQDNVIGLRIALFKRIDTDILMHLSSLRCLEIWNEFSSNLSYLNKLYKLESLIINDVDWYENQALILLEKLYIPDMMFFPLGLVQYLKYPNRSRVTMYWGIDPGLSFLKDLKNLRTLKWRTEPMASVNLSFLKNMTNLKELSLGIGMGTDIDPLINLKSLENLDLSWSHDFRNPNRQQLIDISPVGEMQGLQKLGIDCPYLEDISPLQKLERVRYLKMNTLNTTILPRWIVDWNPQVNLYEAFRNNPLTDPPVEVLKKGRGALREYFRNKESQKKTLEKK